MHILKPHPRLGSLLAVCCLVAAPSAVLAQTNKTSELDALRKVFEEQIKKIDDESGAALQSWPANYARELDALRARLQKSGDFEGWQAADKEFARFKDNPRLAAENVAKDRTDLRALQEKYADLPSAVTLDKHRKVLALRGLYVDRLNALQKKLTVAGKMPDAVAANAEVKRVAALPEVTAAEFAVAAKESEKPPAPVPVPTPPPVVTAKTNAVASEKPLANIEARKKVPDGTKFYQGEAPPPIPEFTFKGLSVSGTDRLRMSRKLSATVSLGRKADSQKTTFPGFFSAVEDRTKSIQYVLRVALRPVNTTTTVENAFLAIQSFAKETAKTGGKIAPKELAFEVIPLPRIDAARSLAVDCPPVTTSSYKRREVFDVGLGIGGASGGQEFYGVIVSVFDEAGALIYQAATNEMLEKMGIAEIPEDFFADRERQMKQKAMNDAFLQAHPNLKMVPMPMPP